MQSVTMQMEKLLAVSKKLKTCTEDIADSVLPFLGTTLLLMHRMAMVQHLD